MIEGMPPHALIDGLMSIRLPEKERNKVLQARVYFQQHGSLPTKVVSSLRTLYKRRASAIQRVQDAREAARISLAREKMGLSERDAKAASDLRIAEMRDAANDLGF